MPVQRIHLERLERLAAFLKGEVPYNRFDYKSWAGMGWDEDEALDSPECQTSACVLGWATVMPEFRDLGLRLVPNKRVGEVKALIALFSPGKDPVVPGTPWVSDPCFELIMERLFGDAEAGRLFFPNERGDNENSTPEEVADKILRWVAVKRRALGIPGPGWEENAL